MIEKKHLKSFTINFDPTNGLADTIPSIKRPLSKMQGMYIDNKSFEIMVKESDPLVYEFYDVKRTEKSTEIAFGTSIIYPGKVGDEYFMTKGHFHTILDTAEIYYCLRGQGYLLMENPEGVCEIQEMKPGCSIYVPGRYAHRTVNISPQGPLIVFFAFRADAGHDYGTIESKGFHKLVIEKNGRPQIIDNPGWKS